MSDLQFLSESGQLLVVRNPIQIFSWVPWVSLLFLTCLLGFGQSQIRTQARFQNSFFSRNAMLLLWSFSLLVYIGTAVWSHTFSMSRASGTATLDDRWLGLRYHTQSIPLDRIDSAVTESARGGMRIALILKDGETVYPFGRAFNTKYSQYRAIQDINHFVGQSSTSAAAPSETDEQERHADQMIRKATEESNWDWKKHEK